MTKILGLLIFCALLSPSQGKVFAIRTIFSPRELSKFLSSSTEYNGLLQNRLKEGIVLPDMKTGGLLGLPTKIVGLKIVDAQLTGYTTLLVPEINGCIVSPSIRIEIRDNDLHAASPSTKISLELTCRVRYGLVNYSGGSVDLQFHECGCELGAPDISLLGRTLPTSAENTIKESITSNINRKICSVMSAVLNGVRDVGVASFNVDLPFGSYGTLKYQLADMPTVRDTFVEYDISADFELAEGGLISIPNDTVSISQPPIQNYSLCQSLHPAFLNMVMSVVGNMEPREFTCTPDVFSGAAGLKDAILALIPPGGSGINTTTVWYLNISLLEGPVIDFANKTAVGQLLVQIEVFIKNADGPPTSILSVRDSLKLTSMFSVMGHRLILTLSIDSHDLRLVSSSVGISEVASLLPHCNSLLGERILPLLSGPLGGGIPLPRPLRTPLDKAKVWIAEGALVTCV